MAAESTISQKQIRDGAINDAKVQAGAAIASSKLADGANFIKKDGSVAFTADQSHGGFKATNVAAPVSGTDAANKTYVDNLISGLNSVFDSKGSVRVKSTGNLTVSNPGTSTIDGVTVVSGERVLLASQTAPAENGLYVFNGSGVAMTRTTDMDAWAEVPGAFVAVEEGTANADTLWLCTANAGGTLNTTSITWFQVPTTPGLLSSNFVTREIPSGAINGSNTTFTLANAPSTGSEEFNLNGLLQNVGAGNDYTISSNTITTTTAPVPGDVLLVSYRK